MLKIFTSTGNMIMTVHQLNMSWTVAAEKARLNSSRLLICKNRFFSFIARSHRHHATIMSPTDEKNIL